MKISAAHIKRYKEICVLLLKYGRADLVTAIDLDESFGGEQLPTSAPEATAGSACRRPRGHGSDVRQAGSAPVVATGPAA
jgi:hypothetical protein